MPTTPSRREFLAAGVALPAAIALGDEPKPRDVHRQLLELAAEQEKQRRARFAAVYGIVGFISVPITFMSIRWWRTIHPVVIGATNAGAKGQFDMTPPMVQVLLFSFAAFTVLYFCFLFNRLRLSRLQDRVEQMKAQLQAA